MIESSVPIRIDRFFGLFSTGSDDHVPKNHFIDTLNCIAEGSHIKTREGTERVLLADSVKRLHVYKKLGEIPHLLWLDDANSLYDMQGTDPNVPILTVTDMTDFSILTMYNRCYITPHNKSTGLPGEKVYVYDGTGLVRPAAGSAPTGFTLGVAESATVGNIEAGERLFAISYETSSGFITVPGPTSFTAFTSTGSKKIDLTDIPIGPAGTIARHIVCTKKIATYDGNQEVQSYFFVPTGRIDNNTDVSYTINFFDANLIRSANYLFDQLSEIPASLALIDYQGSMVAYGENAYTYIVRVSKQGEPESFNSELGFVVAEPGDSTGVKACVEYRSQLYICKANRTGVTQRMAGEEAAFWNYTSVDRSVGTEVYGISTILDTRGNTIDYFALADRSGLLLFDGSYRINLTAKIQTIWDSINKAAFNTIQVAIDPTKNRIYVSIPVGNETSPTTLLVGDVGGGWSAEGVRWFKWVFPGPITTILVTTNNTTQKTEFLYGSNSGSIYKLSESSLYDYGVAIDSYIISALLAPNESSGLNTFTGVRLRVKGSGLLQINIAGMDDYNIVDLTSLSLSTTPGHPLHRNCNYVTEKASIQLRVSNSGEYFELHDFILYAVPLWNERPQE